MRNQELSRRTALKTLLAGAAAAVFGNSLRLARADDVGWLAEVQKPPAKPDEDRLERLDPLLIDSEGRPITTLEGWIVRRDELRRSWMDFLGPMPSEQPANTFKVLREDKLTDCVRQLVEYDSEPDLPVQGYLLTPTNLQPKERRPAVVALHPTTDDSIDEIAGVRGRPDRHLGLELCRRGFVVFCPRCFLWQDAKDYNEAVASFQKRHPKTLGMHKMLYDAMRAVDVISTLENVDAARIGAVGHSLGAKETLYLAAFDDRIKAAVFSEGGIGLTFTNWQAPWYLGESIRETGFPLNHHQLLALIAPRPFLLLGGEQGPGAADGDRSWPFIEAALSVYELYGHPARIGLYNHRQGHAIPPEAKRRMLEWLETYLE